MTAPLTDAQLDDIAARARLAYDGGDPLQTVGYDVPSLVAEVRRLRALVNPDAWTAPDGTVLDLARPVLDRDGDEWVLEQPPLLTMAMVDGDLGERTLPELFRRFGPLTQDERPEPSR